MSKKNRLHVVPREKGWAVKREGAERASKLTSTKKEAEKYAKDIAKEENGEVVIHGTDNKIQDSDSYGNDPNPPKDNKH